MSDAPPPMLSSLVSAQPGTRFTVDQVVHSICEEVTLRPKSVAPVESHLQWSAPDEDWDFARLRDYVTDEIAKVVGVFPRNKFKEDAIFTRFVKDWGSKDSARIARYAFEVAGGYWRNAPISVNRFCAASDEYFARPILDHLNQVDATRV